MSGGEKKMEHSKKITIKVILLIYIMLMIVRVMELLFVKTDQTWIGENIWQKICCILMVGAALGLMNLRWKDIGFTMEGLRKGVIYGLALGISTLLLSYAAEFAVLFAMGKHPSLRFYVTNFSLSKTNVTGLSVFAVLVCILGNIVNVWAEEGLFRGLFLNLGKRAFSQKGANLIQAVLFGVWHITNVLTAVLDGSMSIGMAVFMGFGYVLLSGILAYEWGLCMALTGTIWTGAFEHFFNNFISNALHTVTETGADEMMIIRITLSNILSLTFVVLISRFAKKKKHSEIC